LYWKFLYYSRYIYIYSFLILILFLFYLEFFFSIPLSTFIIHPLPPFSSLPIKWVYYLCGLWEKNDKMNEESDYSFYIPLYPIPKKNHYYKNLHKLPTLSSLLCTSSSFRLPFYHQIILLLLLSPHSSTKIIVNVYYLFSFLIINSYS
jgi:hypothetical protein